MQKIAILVSSALLVVLTAGSASARPCCSACAGPHPPPACHTVGCTPTCLSDQDNAAINRTDKVKHTEVAPVRHSPPPGKSQAR